MACCEIWTGEILTLVGFHKIQIPPALPSGSTITDSAKLNLSKKLPIAVKGTLLSIRAITSGLWFRIKLLNSMRKLLLKVRLQLQVIISIENKFGRDEMAKPLGFP